MNCDHVLDLLSELLDDRVDEEVRSQIFQHLDQCESCFEVFQSLNEAVEGLRDLPEISPPEGLLDKVHMELDSLESVGQIPMIRRLAPYVGGVATLAAGFAAILLLNSDSPDLPISPVMYEEITSDNSDFKRNLAASKIMKQDHSFTQAGDDLSPQDRLIPKAETFAMVSEREQKMSPSPGRAPARAEITPSKKFMAAAGESFEMDQDVGVGDGARSESKVAETDQKGMITPTSPAGSTQNAKRMIENVMVSGMESLNLEDQHIGQYEDSELDGQASPPKAVENDLYRMDAGDRASEGSAFGALSSKIMARAAPSEVMGKIASTRAKRKSKEVSSKLRGAALPVGTRVMTMPAGPMAIPAGALAEAIPAPAKAQTIPAGALAEAIPAPAKVETIPAGALAETVPAGTMAEAIPAIVSAKTKNQKRRSRSFLEPVLPAAAPVMEERVIEDEQQVGVSSETPVPSEDIPQMDESAFIAALEKREAEPGTGDLTLMRQGGTQKARPKRHFQITSQGAHELGRLFARLQIREVGKSGVQESLGVVKSSAGHQGGLLKQYRISCEKISCKNLYRKVRRIQGVKILPTKSLNFTGVEYWTFEVRDPR